MQVLPYPRVKRPLSWPDPRPYIHTCVHIPYPLHLGPRLRPQSELLPNSSTTFTIPTPKPSRRPANIPLRALSSTAGAINTTAALAAQSNEKDRRSSLSRSSSSSDRSWSDTGDLAEQWADAEDPLQIRLRPSLDEEVWGNQDRRPRRVRKTRFRRGSTVETEKQAGIVKEDIEIPRPAPRYITRVEHIIAALMMRGERQMNGLTGKSLV